MTVTPTSIGRYDLWPIVERFRPVYAAATTDDARRECLVLAAKAVPQCRDAWIEDLPTYAPSARYALRIIMDSTIRVSQFRWCAAMISGPRSYARELRGGILVTMANVLAQQMLEDR
jgi:hypothetical protein